MKFGKYLEQVALDFEPEWKNHLLPYRQLKKALDVYRKTGDGTAFYSLLEQQLEKIETFYHKEEQKLRSLRIDEETTTEDEMQLIERRGSHLLQFVAISHTGILKILKKCDKVTKGSSSALTAEWRSKLRAANFMRSREVDKLILDVQHTRKLHAVSTVSPVTTTGTTAPLTSVPLDEEVQPDTSPAQAQANPKPEKSSSGLYAFVFGAFIAQTAENVYKLLLPLVYLQLTDVQTMAFISAVVTGLDSAGTLLGGSLNKMFSPRRLLVQVSLMRILFTGLITGLYMAQAQLGLSSVALLSILAFINCCDTLLRGVLDSTRSILPVVLYGFDKEALDHINVRYWAMFELGALIGPLAAAVMMAAGLGLQWCLLLIVLPLVAASISYSFLPTVQSQDEDVRKILDKNLVKELFSLKTVKDLWKAPNVGAIFLFTLLAQLHRQRTTLPQILAVSLWNNDSYAAWIYSAFSVGCIPGNILYANLKFSYLGNASLYVAGLVVLGWCWIPAYFSSLGWPGDFTVIMLGCAFFSTMSTQLRTFLQSALQSSLSAVDNSSAKEILAFNRFAVNGMGTLLKLLVALVWWIANDNNSTGFLILSASLAPFALGSLWLASVLERRTSANSYKVLAEDVESPKVNHANATAGAPERHDQSSASLQKKDKGYLIVFEGLDGAGKSTQVERLKGYLQGQGFVIWGTAWSKPILHWELIRGLKRDRHLRSVFLTVVQAMDFRELVSEQLASHMGSDKIVVCDRYYYTALARGAARGFSSEWLKWLYQVDLQPNMVIYPRIEPKIAVSRVLQRAAFEKPTLSDDAQDHKVVVDVSKVSGGQRESARGQTATVSIYEAGLDVAVDEADVLQHFVAFQTQVSNQYDRLGKQLGFFVVDATLDRNTQAQTIASHVMHDLSLKNVPHNETTSVFDKLPSVDHEDLRNAYNGPEGLHNYFRNMNLPMRQRVAAVLDLSQTPRVLLHGNPHLNNFSKADDGVPCMADFDRACEGPYIWDIIRFIISMSLKQAEPTEALKGGIVKCFHNGYEHGLLHPGEPFIALKQEAEAFIPLPANSSPAAFFEKRLKELRKNPVQPNDEQLVAVLTRYQEALGEQIYNGNNIIEAGSSLTWHRRRVRYIVLLCLPENPSGVLFDIKPCVEDAEDSFFHNPTPSNNGQRMVDASRLYSPGFGKREAAFVQEGVHYFGRQLPLVNRKLNATLAEGVQRELAYCVGCQLGRGHVLSASSKKEGVSRILFHFKTEWPRISQVAEQMKNELIAGYQRYMANLNSSQLLN